MASVPTVPRKNPYNPFPSPSPTFPVRSGPRAEAPGSLGEFGEGLKEYLRRKQGVVRTRSASPLCYELTSDEQRRQNEVSASQLAARNTKNLEALATAGEYLGRDNVHGMKDVGRALGIEIDLKMVPLIPYAREDFEASKRMTDATGGAEMLVLFIGDTDGSPIRGKRLIDIVQPQYDDLGLGTLLADEYWQMFDETQEPAGITYEWKLITKQCIPKSKNVPHGYRLGDSHTYADTQEAAIEYFANLTGVRRSAFHRPDPDVLLYAIAIHLLTTKTKFTGKGERLFEHEAHWTDLLSPDNEPLYVGYAGRGGARVRPKSRDGFCPAWGVALWRDPIRPLTSAA